MARLWMPRISPRCRHKFHGVVFHRERNIWDTGGRCRLLCGLSGSRYASTPRPTRFTGDRQTNRRTSRKAPLRRGLNPLIATLQPQSNGPSYSNTVIGTNCTIVLRNWRPQTCHTCFSSMYQLRIIRRSTIIDFGF